MSEFHKRKGRATGSSQCKSCRYEKLIEWRNNNLDKRREIENRYARRRAEREIGLPCSKCGKRYKGDKCQRCNDRENRRIISQGLREAKRLERNNRKTYRQSEILRIRTEKRTLTEQSKRERIQVINGVLSAKCKMCSAWFPKHSVSKSCWSLRTCGPCAKEVRHQSYLRNKERILEKVKTYQRANRDKLRETERRYRNTHKGYESQKDRRRRIRHKSAEGFHTDTEWENLLDTFGHKCLKCGKHESETELTRDHIVPLGTDGGTDYISNIQPLCRSCNSSKGHTYSDYR